MYDAGASHVLIIDHGVKSLHQWRELLPIKTIHITKEVLDEFARRRADSHD